jgi:[NiFe] hydrogenase diaphorase moiety large subunit
MSDDVDDILSRHQHQPTRLVQIFRDVMTAGGVISPPVITHIAARLGLPRARVEGVAGFYAFFTTTPRGRYRVLFSDNITDEMQGGTALRQRLLDHFGVRLGQVSADGLVSIDTTSCTGLCDQGPALLVNGHAIARLTPARIGAISSLIRGGAPVDEWPANLLKIDVHIERRDLLLATPLGPGEAIAAALSRGAEATIDEIDRSGLRGRGGAGFGTVRKWRACRAAPKTPRVVVVNADEGEPGTFKDRVLLSDFADLVIEGATVAAFAVGASRGFLYVRGEYGFLAEALTRKLAERRRANLLGVAILGVPGFDFDLEIHFGAGAYVCGEESALIESLEGKRGIPRNRPPYPVTHGYLGLPTTVQNVETLVAAAFVARHGGDWLRQRGTSKSPGTKILSVAGDVARPGLYEVPFGTPAAEVLAMAGATDTQAIQVGGPSGTLLGAHELGRRIAFEDVPSAGAFMVFDQRRDMLAVVDNFTRFFAHESCGFCTPCRVGTTLLKQTTARLVAGQGTGKDLKDLTRIATVMRTTSHCGLGTTAPNPLVDALAKFRPAFERRVRSSEVLPVFDIDAALAPARQATGRDDALAHVEEEPE